MFECSWCTVMGFVVGMQLRWNLGVGGTKRAHSGPKVVVEVQLSRLVGLETSGKGLTRQGGLGDKCWQRAAYQMFRGC